MSGMMVEGIHMLEKGLLEVYKLVEEMMEAVL